MLELPEVITLSKQVNNALSGKTITQVFNATKPHKFTFYNGNPSEYGKLKTREPGRFPLGLLSPVPSRLSIR